MSALESEGNSRTCTKCVKTKPINEFSRKGDDYTYQCKACVAAYVRDWTAKRKAALDADESVPAPTKLAPAPKAAAKPKAAKPKPSKPLPARSEAPRITSSQYPAPTVSVASAKAAPSPPRGEASPPPPPVSEPVDHPAHYNGNPSGVECIDVVEHMPFNVGNAVKYLWRAGLKGDALEDLRKSIWYIEREIARLERGMVR